jgi:cysteinyl-tRNA synthetase
MEQSKKGMETLNNLIYNLKFISERNEFSKQINMNSKRLLKTISDMEEKFIQAMDDDFNTPIALSTLYSLAKETNIYLNKEINKNKEIIEKVIQFYEQFGNKILGLAFIPNLTNQEQVPKIEIEELIKDREIARKNRDWQTADQIRNKLNEMGIVIEDTIEGTRWKKC